MSYNDPVRLFLKGDRVVAARYVRTARTLLFNTIRQAAGAGVTQGRHIFKLGAGVTVEVLFAGNLAGIVITAPQGGVPTFKIEEQFVTWPRTVPQPDGIDPEHPQLMHSIKDKAWRTLFYSPEIAGYEDFDAPKGTYRTENTLPVFPNGVRHAGNIDWRRKDGVRISWYGPSTRYFYDPFVQPQEQFGTKVFMLGQVLLDVEQYIVDSAPDSPFNERYVLGAALQGTDHLLVIHAELPYMDTPSETIPAGTVKAWMPVTYEVTPLSVPVTLCRYEIARPDPVEDPTRWEVVPGSRVQLTAMPIDNALNPWFFNESATTAVSAMPPSDVFFAATDTAVVRPPESVGRICLMSDVGGVITRNLSLAPGTSSAAIAADFKGDQLVEMTVERSPNNDGADVFTIGMGGRRYEVFRETRNGADTNQTITLSYFLYADLREDTLALFERQFTVVFDGGTTVTTHKNQTTLYCGDASVADGYGNLDLTFVSGLPTTIAAPTRGVPKQLATLTLTPQFFLYQIRARSQVFPVSLVELRMQGLHGGFRYLARPSWHYWGGYGVYNALTDQPAYAVADSATPSAPLDFKTDFDAHTSVLGCAAYEGVAMLSTYAARAPLGAAANLVCSPELPTTLPILTGVTGAKERYHPIWLLGALPGAEG